MATDACKISKLDWGFRHLTRNKIRYYEINFSSNVRRPYKKTKMLSNKILDYGVATAGKMAIEVIVGLLPLRTD